MKCFEELKEDEIIRTLKRDELELLGTKTTSISYRKGDSIIKKEERITQGLFLCSGYVKLHSEFKNKAVIFNIVGPNSFISLGSMISSDKHPFDITAIDECTVCFIDIQNLRKLAQANGLFASKVLQDLNLSMLHYINHNLASLTQNNIHGRLANALLHLAEKVFKAPSFDLMLTRKELSQFCNISRENVIKVLYEFNNDGLIRLSGKKIHILSADNLRRVADHG